MDFSILEQAVNSAAQAAGVARLPGAVRDLGGAVASADTATALTQKAAGLLSAAAPLAKGPNAELVQRAVGIIDLAAKDLGMAGDALLQEAGARLGVSNAALKKALGGELNEQTAVTVVNNLQSAAGLAFDDAPANAFLLEIAGNKPSQLFRFALGQAAYDTLRRSKRYNTPAQERLTRQSATQGVGIGGETIHLSGAVFLASHGAGHIDKLRAIADLLQPVTLTTGYGESFGRWYINSIDEDQSFHFADGAPRKQAFALEFARYGDDYQNL